MFDAKTFQNQIARNYTLKASSFDYDGSDNFDHHNFVQLPRPVKTYHFDYAYVCFTKDTDSYAFITRLKNLPIIFNETTYDLTKMDERDFKDHVIQLHDAQKVRREKFEEELAGRTNAEKLQVEAIAKVVDNNIINEVIIDLNNTYVMDQNPQTSKSTQADEVINQQKEPVSKQLETLHEATSRKKDVPDAVIVYSTSSCLPPITYAPSNTMTRDQVHDWSSNTFVERHKQENE